MRQVLQSATIRKCDSTVAKSSDVNRPDLHLGAFGEVVRTFPGPPVHAVSDRRVMTVVVQAVQVGAEAIVVPPGAMLAQFPTSRWSLSRSLVVKTIILCHASESSATPGDNISPVVEISKWHSPSYTSTISSCLLSDWTPFEPLHIVKYVCGH